MQNVTFIRIEDFPRNEEPICRSDTQEIVDAIKNDKPIPVTQEQFDLINFLTKQMLKGMF